MLDTHRKFKELKLYAVPVTTNPLESENNTNPSPKMFALRSRLIARQTVRSFTTRSALFNAAKPAYKTAASLEEVNGSETLIGQGAKEGTFPTDLEQATGLERLELLAKLQGVELFDTKPLDSSRIGTIADPILVESYDDYRYVGCTGSPADSHAVEWLKPTVDQVARCWECGSVYKINPVGVPQDDHHH